MKPLRYFEQIEYFEHKPDTNRTVAALFRQCVVAPGFETVTEQDVARMHPQAKHVLLRAINEASAPEDAPDPDDADDDSTLSDRIDSLHQLDYTFPDLYGLLSREIELVAEGARRRNERQKDDSGSGSTTVESAEGTQMGGGPADGIADVDFVDASGEPLQN